MITRTAQRLPHHHGPAAWDAILPPRIAGQMLDADTSVDFAVVGAGFAGMAAARRLTQISNGSRIAVLEAGAVAEGASGRNSGFMIDLPHELTSEDYAGSGNDHAIIAMNRSAIEFAQSAVDDYGIRSDYFDRVGKINGAASAAADAHNSSYANHLNSLDENSERLDAAQMQEVTGSTYYRSGLYTPGTVMLQPAGFMRGMADGLRRDGIAVFEHTPALSFEQDGAGWIINTPKARLRTAKIILTVNGHLESFGFAQNRLMHVFLFATITPELDEGSLKKLGGKSRWGITPSDPMGTTLRRIDTAQGGNRIVTRTCAVLRSDLEATGRDLTRARLVMRQKFDLRFPQLAGLQMEHAWGGHLCLSSNGVAVTGEVEQGIYSGCVQNGLGTARGTLTGIAAAELACGVSSDITQHFAREAEPKKLPPRLVRDFGANAVLRFKEWKARAE